MRLALAITNLSLDLLVEHLHRVHHLLQVGNCRLCFGAVLQTIKRQQTASHRHLHTEVVQSLMLALERQVADEFHKLGHLLHDCLLDTIGWSLLDKRIYRLPHRHLTLLRHSLDARNGGIANASRWGVDNALESLVIARVYDKADIREHILHLLMVIERATAIDAIRYRLLTQCIFESLRLVVRTVENRRLCPLATILAHAVTQVRHHQICLLAVGVRLEDANLLATRTLREAAFLQLARVVVNHRVGGIYDGLCRAVVLLQLKDLRLWIVALEREDILDLRTTERIDTLCIVTHHADARMELRQATHDDILRVVSILILIDQHILESLLIARQYLGMVAEKEVGLQEQIVEIHRAIEFATTAILNIDITKLRYLRPTILGCEHRILDVCTRGYQVIFRHRNARSDNIRFVLIVAQTLIFEDGFEEIFAVGRLVDGVLLRIAQHLGILTQDARKYGVERTHTDVATVRADHLLDTLTHLARRLISKGKRENRVRSHTLRQHIGDTGGEYACFARASTCNNQRRLVICLHSSTLRGIQPLQDIFIRHSGCKDSNQIKN